MTAVVLWIVLAAAVALASYWGVALWRVAGLARSAPSPKMGLEHLRAHPSAARVAAIIPAHNEERALEVLLPTLAAQDYPWLSVVLCLDRCTDGSEAVARRLVGGDPRVTILPIERCPPDWSGKVHAVWTGVRAALGSEPRPDVLLFADADTQMHPSCVSSAVGLLERGPVDVVSYLSTMTYDRWFEWVAQPAAGMELMRQYPIERVNRRDGRRRSFANGQFMMFRREAYEAVGGHEAVKDELLEDLALARAVREGWGGFARDGVPGGGGLATLALAGPMLTCRMYESWGQFEAGWRRIFVEGARRRTRRLIAGMHVCLWAGGLGPILVAGGGALGAWVWWRGEPSAAVGVARAASVASAVALAMQGAALVAIFRLTRTPMRAVAGFWVGSLLCAWVLWRAACDLRRGRPTRWAGRAYVRTPR